MADTLLSVGLDVGTTSTQLVVSRLTVENQASAAAVPSLAITGRQVLYRSPVHFTPLLDESHVDGEALARLLEAEYRRAGIRPDQVDTGAVIITGETSRKENAATVLNALSHAAGDFVVTTAGPDLESILAARGAGALEASRSRSGKILHMDIGGGTTNLCLCQEGRILATGCLNVGGRLIKLAETGVLRYVSPVLKGIFPYSPGQVPSREDLLQLVRQLTQVLEMGAGLRQKTPLLDRLLTQGASPWQVPADTLTLSFSGGVAECIREEKEPLAYGDLGPLLGRAIRDSRLCQGNYLLQQDAIRATVIGAGCHSTQLSGSTVFRQNVELPLRDLPVIPLDAKDLGGDLADSLTRKRQQVEGDGILLLPVLEDPSYGTIRKLADQLAAAVSPPCYLCIRQDMAKALGQALALRLGPAAGILCIDGLSPGTDDYLDIGKPLGPALPVVVKTLILER